MRNEMEIRRQGYALFLYNMNDAHQDGLIIWGKVVKREITGKPYVRSVRPFLFSSEKEAFQAFPGSARRHGFHPAFAKYIDLDNMSSFFPHKDEDPHIGESIE